MSSGYIEYPITSGGGSGNGITSLTGDVTASGPGAAAATVVSAGGGSGDFSALDITLNQTVNNPAINFTNASDIGTTGNPAGNIYATNINLPFPSPTTGQIFQTNVGFLFNTYTNPFGMGNGNFFFGGGGNYTLTSTPNPQSAAPDGNIGTGGGGVLGSLTTGSNNIAFGCGLVPALSNLTSGYSNIYMGDGENGPITTQNSNTCIGGWRPLDYAVGNNNVALGCGAGTGGIDTIDNSTYLGNGTTPSSTSGITNETVIGYQAHGQGSNTMQLGSTAVTLVNTSGQVRCASLGIGNSASATTPGSVVAKIEVFNASGASLGFLPVYSSIT